MHFCKNCENMYYIKLQNEEGIDNQLAFYCRNCGYVDEILNQESMCLVSYDKNTNESGISNSINAYTKYDPTLPHVHNILCINKECISNREDNGKQSDVIYIRYNDNDMKYLYMCVYCDKVWKSSLQ